MPKHIAIPKTMFEFEDFYSLLSNNRIYFCIFNHNFIDIADAYFYIVGFRPFLFKNPKNKGFCRNINTVENHSCFFLSYLI